MTPGCMEWISAKSQLVNGDVLEVGSLDMNGSPRSLFADRERFPRYVGIDLAEGPGVDEVMDCHDLRFMERTFDVIVDAERLEHDKDFFRSYWEIYRVLRPGGHVIVTARSWGGFHPHCLPKDFWRFTAEGLRHLLTVTGFEIAEVKYGEEWTADRNCGQTGGCPEHPSGGIHEDVFAHAVYGFARKP